MAGHCVDFTIVLLPAKLKAMRRLIISFLLLSIYLFPPPIIAQFCATVASGTGCTGSTPYSCTPTLCCDGPTACHDYQVSQSDNGPGDVFCPDGSVNTAVGCLHAESPGILIIQLLGWGVIVGGGIAFLLIIFAAFQITTAAGDPKKVKAGQELITAAVSGLILIIFSIVLLNFIGFNLLQLPGFVGNPNI